MSAGWLLIAAGGCVVLAGLAGVFAALLARPYWRAAIGPVHADDRTVLRLIVQGVMAVALGMAAVCAFAAAIA